MTKTARNTRFERFTFTGKERDAETGYSYFGARYYDSELSGLFLSVDPMADKYPSISPYAYCMWNPIKIIDPSGKDTAFVNNEAREMFNHVYNKVSKEVNRLERKNKTNSSQYASLKKMKSTLDDVIKSSTTFYLYSSNIDDEGNTLISGGKTYGKIGVMGICVDFASDSEESFIHEMRHASGYENHEWDVDFSQKDEYGYYDLINYDYQDEFEAYSLANYYGFYFNDKRLRSDYEIKEDVRKYSNFINIIPEFIQYSRSNPYMPINK